MGWAPEGYLVQKMGLLRWFSLILLPIPEGEEARRRTAFSDLQVGLMKCPRLPLLVKPIFFKNSIDFGLSCEVPGIGLKNAFLDIAYLPELTFQRIWIIPW